MSSCQHLILVGPPNSGKTTLFNWITGYNRRTVNYPGSTVELSFGLVKEKRAGFSSKIIDTPGTYSLVSPSSETKAVRDTLFDLAKKRELEGVILVLDSTRLKRQLPFAFHLQSIGVPIVLALTMYDIQKKYSLLNLSLLSKRLKVPAFPIEGLLGGGVVELLKGAHSYFEKQKVSSYVESNFSEGRIKKNQLLFLEKAKKLVDEIHTEGSMKKVNERTKKIDSWLLHPVFGFGFLSLILFSFFSSIFWLAAPLMDILDSSFSWTVEQILRWDETNLFLDFLANGIVTSIGAFFIFVPQVFILFLGIYLLEDSGYLARAVSLVDGPFSKMGLSGKSLIPFLSGFACAIPATISARHISSKRERWITIFVLPLMTCSARLPVYVLLLSFLFYGDSAWKPGLVMSLLYFSALFLGIIFATILNLLMKPGQKSSFMMELPLYRRPVLSNVLFGSWSRTKNFIFKAGPLIFGFAIFMWIATHFPRHLDSSPSEQMQASYAGQVGQIIEPVFEQMGGDWRVGVSLLSAFVAREVFVSVLAVVLQNTESKTENNIPMIQKMKEAHFSDGRPLFSTASILSLIVFFVLSLQCLSTTGIVYKETGSWVLALSQLVTFNLIAYVAAVGTFHLF